jgi:hypothetical protein
MKGRTVAFAVLFFLGMFLALSSGIARPLYAQSKPPRRRKRQSLRLRAQASMPVQKVARLVTKIFTTAGRRVPTGNRRSITIDIYRGFSYKMAWNYYGFNETGVTNPFGLAGIQLQDFNGSNATFSFRYSF